MSEETTQVSPTESTETVEQEQTGSVETEQTEQDDGIVYAGKYKSVSDLEKAYSELQSSYSKKLGAFEGSPEEYARPEGIEEGDSSFDFITQWGKDNNLSQDGLESLIGQFKEQATEQYEAQQKEYIQGEMEKLGKDADYRIKNATDWVSANLGEDFVGAINDMLPGAKGIEAIEKLMKTTSAQTPTEASPTKSLDMEQIKGMRFAKDEFGNRKMSVDPAYRKRVEALEAEYYSNK